MMEADAFRSEPFITGLGFSTVGFMGPGSGSLTTEATTGGELIARPGCCAGASFRAGVAETVTWESVFFF